MTTSDALDWAIPVVVGLGALLLLAVILLAVALSRLAKLSGQNHPQLWHIDEDELHIDCNEQGQPVVLSHHSAGEVYGGTYRGTRVVLTPRLVANTHDQVFEREAATVVSLRHPRVVTVFGLCELNARPYLVRELTAMGSLPDVLYGGTCKLSPADIALILRDVCEGLLFLHSTVPTPIVHGALKPQNIFIEESWRAKVAFSGKAFSRADPLSGDDMHQAPEVRAGQAPWTEADVYCFGVTAWETWTRTMPADLPPSTSKAHAESGGLPLAYAGLTAEMSELLKDCLVADPAARPKMDVILEKMKSIFQKAPQDSPGDEEKKKADEKLLHSMLPLKVAQALRENRRVEAENFQMVTIFFSDIVGFTVISSKLEPEKVMDMLDKLYSAFDILATNYGLFKVETIGDAYMAVAGLPEPQADHTLRVAKFAMEAVRAAAAIPVDPTDPEMGNVTIRVGVHCGPVVASVVGKLNPRYCLFGDTVNTASRMESNSLSLKINLSDDAAEQLKRQCPALRMTHRGILDIKGKGPMACYFLDQDDENLDMAKTYAFGAAQPVMPAFGVMKGSMYQSKLASFSRLSSKNAGGLSSDEEVGSPRSPMSKGSFAKMESKGTFLMNAIRHGSGGHQLNKSGPHAVSGPRRAGEAVSGGRRVPLSLQEPHAPPEARPSILRTLSNALGAPFKRKVAPSGKHTPGGLGILEEGAEDQADPSRRNPNPTRTPGGARASARGTEAEEEKAKVASAKAWESDDSEEDEPKGAVVVPVSAEDHAGEAPPKKGPSRVQHSADHIEEDVP